MNRIAMDLSKPGMSMEIIADADLPLIKFQNKFMSEFGEDAELMNKSLILKTNLEDMNLYNMSINQINTLISKLGKDYKKKFVITIIKILFEVKKEICDIEINTLAEKMKETADRLVNLLAQDIISESELPTQSEEKALKNILSSKSAQLWTMIEILNSMIKPISQ